MKKLLITTAAFLCIGGAFSQSNVIPSSGNVGIGTTSPTEKLSVKGNVKIDSTLSVDSVLVRELHVGNGMRIEGKSEVEEVVINGPVTVNGKATFGDSAEFNQKSIFHGTAYFQETVMDDQATFNSKVVLTNPQVHTSDLSTFTLLGVNDNGVVKKVGFNTSALPDFIYGPKTCSPNGQITSPTWSNGLNKIFVQCPEVRVGIGTNAPLYSLDTRGIGYFSTGIRIGNSAVSSQIALPAFIEMEVPTSAKNFIRLSVKNGSNAPKTVFKVTNTGDLWCTSAHVRLADSIKIPDYVFRPDYNLMPLSELKVFVNNNNHLPNIPSEAQIKEAGLSLDEMQLKLLEKVEELTLYVIQLEEKNKKLEELNEKYEEVSRKLEIRMAELEATIKK